MYDNFRVPSWECIMILNDFSLSVSIEGSRTVIPLNTVICRCLCVPTKSWMPLLVRGRLYHIQTLLDRHRSPSRIIYPVSRTPTFATLYISVTKIIIEDSCHEEERDDLMSRAIFPKILRDSIVSFRSLCQVVAIDDQPSNGRIWNIGWMYDFASNLTLPTRNPSVQCIGDYDRVR